MGNLRIIDLTKYLDPAKEDRRCHLFRFNTGGPIPDYHTIIDIMSHLGTHVECPYHHHDDWPDVAALPVTTFFGRAVYLNIKFLTPRSYITHESLEAASAGRLNDNDIVILDSPYKLEPFTNKTNTSEDKRLLVNGDTAVWLRDKKVKCVGFGDGVSIENRNEDVKPFHDVLLAENIVFLEVLKNLELLEKEIFFMSYTPLYIKGLDSSPVRAYAIEGLAEFS
jgi:kynurenine formamidase